MNASLSTFEWKQQESPGNHAQAGAQVQGVQRLPTTVVSKLSFAAALNEATRHSRKSDCDLADLIGVSPGYMSKLMRGVFELWAARFVALMRASGSIAPLQAIAHQMGCDVVPRSCVIDQP